MIQQFYMENDFTDLYPIVSILIFILYFCSIIDTIASLIARDISYIKLLAHGCVIIIASGIYLHNKYKTKPNMIMSAILVDDLFNYELKIYQDSIVEHEFNGFLGYKKIIKGKYFIKDSLLIFKNKPYDNDFLPDTCLIDTSQNAIYIETDSIGNFVKERNWLMFYDITYLKK